MANKYDILNTIIDGMLLPEVRSGDVTACRNCGERKPLTAMGECWKCSPEDHDA
jgi:hypothetical protein